MSTPPEVDIYMDGSCFHKTRSGGWASIVMFQSHELIVQGNAQDTTISRMEMTAVLRGIQSLKVPCSITVYCDSQYVCRGLGNWLGRKPSFINPGWVSGWMMRGWRTGQNREVANCDLWRELADACRSHSDVSMVWVKGHIGNVHNERCDRLAGEQRRILDGPKKPVTITGTSKKPTTRKPKK